VQTVVINKGLVIQLLLPTNAQRGTLASADSLHAGTVPTSPVAVFGEQVIRLVAMFESFCVDASVFVDVILSENGLF
jgi:hypothetical protein